MTPPRIGVNAELTVISSDRAMVPHAASVAVLERRGQDPDRPVIVEIALRSGIKWELALSADAGAFLSGLLANASGVTYAGVSHVG
jgi:hypothetical protein